MIFDPIVQEIRDIRKELETQNGADFEAYLKKIYLQQKKNKSRLISHAPKRIISKKAA